jgi:hypothetical protein
MSNGPGKYDSVLTEARARTNAAGAVLIIMGGNQGDGFAVQVAPDYLFKLPTMLRYMADQIDADLERHKA